MKYSFIQEKQTLIIVSSVGAKGHLQKKCAWVLHDLGMSQWATGFSSSSSVNDSTKYLSRAWLACKWFNYVLLHAVLYSLITVWLNSSLKFTWHYRCYKKWLVVIPVLLVLLMSFSSGPVALLFQKMSFSRPYANEVHFANQPAGFDTLLPPFRVLCLFVCLVFVSVFGEMFPGAFSFFLTSYFPRHCGCK